MPAEVDRRKLIPAVDKNSPRGVVITLLRADGFQAELKREGLSASRLAVVIWRYLAILRIQKGRAVPAVPVTSTIPTMDVSTVKTVIDALVEEGALRFTDQAAPSTPVRRPRRDEILAAATAPRS